MNLEKFREEMELYWRAIDEEAKELKESYLALDRLRARYQMFDSVDRSMADQVLAEWVLSDDEGMRFDALALVDEFKIVSATPALRKLRRRLTSSSAPGAPYELQKVDRILRDFE